MASPKTPEDSAAQKKIVTRLRSVEGHLRGVIQMVESQASCVDVLQQTKAIHSALTKIEAMLFDRHLHHCLSKAVRSASAPERQRVIRELLGLFETARRG